MEPNEILLIILGVILAAIVITAIKAYFFRPKKSELEKPPLEPEKADVEGFEEVMKRYTKGLAIEREAVENL